MANILVGIGQIKISDKSEDIIKTMALGSSIAVVFFAPEVPVAGMAHVVLPDSIFGFKRAQRLPGYFADAALPYLISEFKNHIDINNAPGFCIKLAGGSSILDPDGTFNIGQKILTSIEKILTKNQLGISAKDVGKNFTRSVSVEVETGKVFVSAPGRGKWEL